MRYRSLFVHVFAFVMIVSSAAQAGKKKWTVMLFVNGEGVRPAQAQCTLTQLLQIAPSENVAVLSEMKFTAPELGDDGDIKRFSDNVLCFDDHRQTIPLWNGAWRFRLDADADDRLEPLQFRKQPDMNGSAELIDFIQWAKTYSPADRYILIIERHGPDVPYREWSDAFDSLATDFYTTDDRFKIFSVDHAKRDIALYETDEAMNNKTIFAVEFAFPERLNILAFDSCSRAFIENGFALRNFVDIVIASEADIKIGSRWHYEDWIPSLVKHPKMSAKQLGHVILGSYAAKYTNDTSLDALQATLSVTDLHMLGSLAARFDRLVELFHSISVEPQLLQLRPKPYALSNVDFMSFMNNLNQRNVVATTATQAQAQRQFRSSYTNLASSFSAAVEPFAGSRAKSDNGSLGLTIYFPNCDDPEMPMFLNGPYNPDKSDALPMVKAHPKWACILRRLLAQQCNRAVPTALQCDPGLTH